MLSKPARRSCVITSAADRRASSASSALGGTEPSSSRPVEMSAAAMPHLSPTFATATSQLAERESSKASSVSVPAVTTRTIARVTTDLAPRFLASAGLSVCSAMATRWPALMSRAR